MNGELREGMTAPDFHLPTDGGGHVTLASLREGPVIVYFYPKDNTPGCTREAVDFSRHMAEFDSLGATVIGISPDSPAAHDRFKQKHSLAIILAADPDHAAIGPYGVWAEKKLYGRRFMGVVRSTFLIDRDGRIARIWRNVKVPGHADQVLEAARTL